MRGVFGAPHPKNYPICTLLTLPVKDFISDQSAAAEAEELIVRNMQKFNAVEADHVLIACNTAHLLVPSLEKRTGIRFDSLVASVQSDIKRRDLHTIGALASPTSLQQDVHKLTGLEIVRPTDIQHVEKLIRDVVNGIRNVEQVEFLNHEIAGMFDAGAQAILLGCAELEMLLAGTRDKRFIRPLEITIESIMRDNPNKL